MTCSPRHRDLLWAWVKYFNCTQYTRNSSRSFTKTISCSFLVSPTFPPTEEIASLQVFISHYQPEFFSLFLINSWQMSSARTFHLIILLSYFKDKIVEICLFHDSFALGYAQRFWSCLCKLFPSKPTLLWLSSEDPNSFDTKSHVIKQDNNESYMYYSMARKHFYNFYWFFECLLRNLFAIRAAANYIHWQVILFKADSENCKLF